VASIGNSVVCGVIAISFWGLIGYAIARRLVPGVLALTTAPVIGWSVHSAVMLPIVTAFGFSPLLVIGAGSVGIIVAGFSLLLPSVASEAKPAPTIPVWAFAAAGSLAVLPAATLLPKSSGNAVWLAEPIFDHAKVALIDAMTRLGMPPVNPVYAEPGVPARLAYYYLWHFSAAEIALITSTSGWEADIGLTWFTAIASLVLMMGFAVWLSRRLAAASWVVALASAGSLWVTLSWIFQGDGPAPLLLRSIGMAGWLFQATWVPQHLMAASCVVTAMALATRYVLQPSLQLGVIIAFLVAAGFASSAFVGGVTICFAALLAAPLLLRELNKHLELRVLGGLAIAILLVIALISPLVRDQFAAVHARGAGSPIVVTPYRVFDGLFPDWLRRVLDIPGYWLLILPIELPATFIAGTIAVMAVLRGAPPGPEKLTVAVFACLAGAGLGISWLLASTLGANNDLGLRAIIPSEIVLIAIAAAGAAGWRTRVRAVIAAAAAAGVALSVPDFVLTIHDNIVATKEPPDADVFARTPELWAAVRRYSAPDARIANNPLFLEDLTPWPVNISWALLANRSSCFAGREMAIAFAPLSPDRRTEIEQIFQRIFAGEGTPSDVHELATHFGCDVVVIVPQDKAWERDPIATSVDYRLAEAYDGHWRIYVRRP
jgi:hypothetical protein